MFFSSSEPWNADGSSRYIIKMITLTRAQERSNNSEDKSSIAMGPFSIDTYWKRGEIVAIAPVG